MEGVAAERTDEEDEIRISWDALDQTDLNALGPNLFKARLTVIFEGGGDEDAGHVALGDSSLVVDEVEFTKELTVSMAGTRRLCTQRHCRGRFRLGYACSQFHDRHHCPSG